MCGAMQTVRELDQRIISSFCVGISVTIKEQSTAFSAAIVVVLHDRSCLFYQKTQIANLWPNRLEKLLCAICTCVEVCESDEGRVAPYLRGDYLHCNSKIESVCVLVQNTHPHSSKNVSMFTIPFADTAKGVCFNVFKLLSAST